MYKHKLFINWMSTRMKYTTFELSPEHLSLLTYEDFNVFRQEDMIRMRSEPASPPPGPTTPTPLTSQTSGSKKRQAFLSQHNDLLDKPVSESTKTLLDQDEFGSSPSSPFQSSFNSPEPQKLTRVHFHDNSSSPDNPPQDVDISCHLSDFTHTTDSLDASSTLRAPDDSLFNWIQPASHFKHKTPLVLKLNMFLSLKDIWTMPTFHKQRFFFNTMTMNSSY